MMNIFYFHRIILLLCFVAYPVFCHEQNAAHSAETLQTANQKQVSITKTAEGFCWNMGNFKVFFLNGMVYQPVPFGRHIDDYVSKNNFQELFKALLPKEMGGLDQGSQLHDLNVNFIRIYQLSTTNAEDISGIKEIFDFIYDKYGIRILLGNWAGLHRDPNDFEAIKRDIEAMVRIYGKEEWLLAFLIGNENNYFHNNGILRNEHTPEDLRLELSTIDYYNFMNSLAKIAKNVLKEIGIQKPVGLGSGEIFPYESEAVIQEIKDYDFIGYNGYRTPDRMNDYLKLLIMRGISLPVLITECGTPIGATALWGIQDIQPFTEEPQYKLETVIPKSPAPLDLLSAVQKNYLRGFFSAAVESANAIINDKAFREKSLNDENYDKHGRNLKQIYTEALFKRGLSYKNLENYEKAVADFEDIVQNFKEVSIWSLPVEPFSGEERANYYWTIVKTAKNNSFGMGTKTVLGISCFEFTNELWNDTEQNRGFSYKPADDIIVDKLLDLIPRT